VSETSRLFLIKKTLNFSFVRSNELILNWTTSSANSLLSKVARNGRNRSIHSTLDTSLWPNLMCYQLNVIMLVCFSAPQAHGGRGAGRRLHDAGLPAAAPAALLSDDGAALRRRPRPRLFGRRRRHGGGGRRADRDDARQDDAGAAATSSRRGHPARQRARRGARSVFF